MHVYVRVYVVLSFYERNHPLGRGLLVPGSRFTFYNLSSRATRRNLTAREAAERKKEEEEYEQSTTSTCARPIYPIHSAVTWFIQAARSRFAWWEYRLRLCVYICVKMYVW